MATRTSYIQGNTARRLEEVPDISTREVRRVSNTTRKNREKAHHMNVGYVTFLAVALIFAGVTLCSYIELQSDVTNHVKTISSMQSEYNNLKLANDEEYNRINSSIDLEQIKARAIGELGMTYAAQGQIVDVENSETDYVRQVTDVN